MTAKTLEITATYFPQIECLAMCECALLTAILEC